MSSGSKSPPTQAKAGPIRFGWREVQIKRPDGTETLEHVPLTEEEILFPKFGDFIVQTNPHDDDVSYLKAVSKARTARDRTAAVLSDCAVDWNLPGVRPLCPDLAVFTGVARDQGWETFNVRAEGAEPLLVTEVTSPATRRNDLGRKVDFYHRAGVPVYVIVKASGRGRTRGWSWLLDGEPLEGLDTLPDRSLTVRRPAKFHQHVAEVRCRAPELSEVFRHLGLDGDEVIEDGDRLAVGFHRFRVPAQLLLNDPIR